MRIDLLKRSVIAEIVTVYGNHLNRSITFSKCQIVGLMFVILIEVNAEKEWMGLILEI